MDGRALVVRDKQDRTGIKAVLPQLADDAPSMVLCSPFAGEGSAARIVIRVVRRADDEAIAVHGRSCRSIRHIRASEEAVRRFTSLAKRDQPSISKGTSRYGKG